MEPLATYEETRLEGRRTFQLFNDKVVVRGKNFLSSDFEAVVPLSGIRPDYSYLRIRHTGFWAGLILVSMGFVGAAVLISGFDKDPFQFAAGLFEILLITGIIICLATVKKVEFVRFSSESGLVVLDVARSGRDKDRFDEFVRILVETIHKARSQAGTAAS